MPLIALTSPNSAQVQSASGGKIPHALTQQSPVTQTVGRSVTPNVMMKASASKQTLQSVNLLHQKEFNSRAKLLKPKGKPKL